jgi:hypothetical protein
MLGGGCAPSSDRLSERCAVQSVGLTDRRRSEPTYNARVSRGAMSVREYSSESRTHIDVKGLAWSQKPPRFRAGERVDPAVCHAGSRLQCCCSGFTAPRCGTLFPDDTRRVPVSDLDRLLPSALATRGTLRKIDVGVHAAGTLLHSLGVRHPLSMTFATQCERSRRVAWPFTSSSTRKSLPEKQQDGRASTHGVVDDAGHVELNQAHEGDEATRPGQRPVRETGARVRHRQAVVGSSRQFGVV